MARSNAFVPLFVSYRVALGSVFAVGSLLCRLRPVICWSQFWSDTLAMSKSRLKAFFFRKAGKPDNIEFVPNPEQSATTESNLSRSQPHQAKAGYTYIHIETNQPPTLAFTPTGNLE